MSKLEDNTKRRSNEVEEQSVTPRPPKKRFLSRASSPDEDAEDNEDASDSFKVISHLPSVNVYSVSNLPLD